MVLDFWKKREEPSPLYIKGGCVERVSSFKFLGVHLSEDLPWKINTTQVARKAQQRLHFLRVLRKNKVEQRLMTSFYQSTIESILSYCISVWYAGLTAADRKMLQRVVSTAQNIVGCPLIPLQLS
uniref:Alkylated DNA repair protein AlkB homologue 8 N-terminal domain-containing protein n=1 Tax=Micrurus paraensis TaxID=1970185 RepID=A0A2D4KJK7_9SAUR